MICNEGLISINTLRLCLKILATVSFLLILGPVHISSGQTDNLSEKREPAPLFIFSTRTFPNLNPVQLTDLINFTVSKFGSCPPEIAMYIHGWNKDQNGA